MKKLSTKQIVKEIERIRLEKKWSRPKMISYLKITASTLSRWEAGLLGPSLENYLRITKKLNLISVEPINKKEKKI